MRVWVILIINNVDPEDVDVRVFGGINGEERANAEFAKLPSEYDELEYTILMDQVHVQ